MPAGEQDAIAEIHYFGTHGYRWVLDADIEAASDNLSHSCVLERGLTWCTAGWSPST